jgi:hypothetical protein
LLWTCGQRASVISARSTFVGDLSFWLAGAKQFGHGEVDVGDKRFGNRLILRQVIAAGNNDSLLKFETTIRNFPKIAFDECLGCPRLQRGYSSMRYDLLNGRWWDNASLIASINASFGGFASISTRTQACGARRCIPGRLMQRAFAQDLV